MRVRGLIQSSETQEISAEADDAASARELLIAQVPNGFDLIQVHNAMPRGGRVIATGMVRAVSVQEINAEGSTYDEARDNLRARVPETMRLLSIVVERDA